MYIFFKLLTNFDNLQLTCFVADILFILKNFQKQLQSDAFTIVDIKPQLDIFTQKLTKLCDTMIIGGWEETLLSEVKIEDQQKTVFCTELWEKNYETLQ